MKIYSTLLLLLGFLCACEPTPELASQPLLLVTAIDSPQLPPKVVAKDTLPPLLVSIKAPAKSLPPPTLAQLTMDDSTLYDTDFITQLRMTKGMKTVELQQGKMILNGKDSITFPTFLPLNKYFILTARQENLAIALSVKRINYTSIEYKTELVEFGKASKIERGVAHLSPLFFLGSESDVEEKSQESYFSIPYHNNQGSCYISLRLGQLDDRPNGPLLAKIEKNCNGKIRNISLGNYPTLREK